MANNLTGDFDVVAEFSIFAADRVLAAMHRAERLPHSMTLRVDDVPRHRYPPVLVGAVDEFGTAVVNQNVVGNPNPFPGLLASTDAVYSGLRPVVNAGNVIVPITPTNFQGVAQLQLAPPTVEVPDASGSNLTVRMNIMSRYFPDPNTAPAAEFVRGDLLLTAGVNQVASQSGNMIVVNVNISGNDVNVSFNRQYSSSALSAGDLAGINLLIRNGLQTSFLPSNSTLPESVKHLQFKTLLTPLSVIGVLLNLNDTQGNAASVNDVFLSPIDDFGLGVGSDFIVQQFTQQLIFQPPSLSFLSYSVSVNAPTIELQTGKIVLKIKGHAHSSVLPDFNFTLTQNFTLNLAETVAGGPLDTAVLAVSGDISVDVSGLSFLFDWIADDFISSALGPIRAQRDAVVQAHEQNVKDMFSANKILGSFLNQLLNPALPPTGDTPPQNVNFVLAYTSIDITTSGIVLHGSMSVTPWPAAHVEYQPIPARTTGVHVPPGIRPQGPDYSALNTWIPGGTITEYDWSYEGQSQPFYADKNRFVLLSSGPTVVPPKAFVETVSGVQTGYRLLCLTVKGARLTPSGVVSPQPVTGSVCGYNTFPVVNGLNAVDEGAAIVALAQAGPGGMVQVVGHTPAQAHVDQAGRGTPNVIVHFADDKTSASLDFLSQAVTESGRTDATTAIIAVLTAQQMTKSRYAKSVIYGDSQNGGWERAFGLKNTPRPMTLIASPTGKIVWRQGGDIDSKTLAEALKNNLTAGGAVQRCFPGVYLRLRRRPPNFVFDLGSGAGLTLHKLSGRSVILIFWRSTSQPSIEAVRDLQDAAGKAGRRGPVVLAINDGEPADVAAKVFAANNFTATLVTDPARMISIAYGVSVWPTIVLVDASGVVTGVRYGRILSDPSASPADQPTAPSQPGA